MKKKDVSFIAIGDTFITYDVTASYEWYGIGYESAISKVAPMIRAADIAFTNMEGCSSNKGSPRRPGAHPPMEISALSYLGLDVVSLANNHVLDRGVEAFLDTLDQLDQKNILHCGAGKNLVEARKPAILERKGIRIAFLGYASVYDPIYEAAAVNKPGIAPIRTDPLFPSPHLDEEQLDAMVEDIKATKNKADIVVVAHHWGAGLSRTLQVPNIAIAHECIDAGADMVLGYHPHVLQAIEMYKGKVICYSMGGFLPVSWKFAKIANCPYLSHEIDDSMILNCVFSDKGVTSAYINLTRINWHGKVEILQQKNEKFKEIYRVLEKLSKKVGTKLTLEKDKVWIKKD